MFKLNIKRRLKAFYPLTMRSMNFLEALEDHLKPDFYASTMKVSHSCIYTHIKGSLAMHINIYIYDV